MTSTRTDQALGNVLGTLPAQGSTITLSLTTSAATTATACTAGATYDMVCDVDCFVCACAVGADSATTSDYFLPALTVIPMSVYGTSLYVSGIVASGTGTLFLSPREAVGVAR